MAFCRAAHLRAEGAGINFKKSTISDKIALKATQSYHAVAVKDVKVKGENKMK